MTTNLPTVATEPFDDRVAAHPGPGSDRIDDMSATPPFGRPDAPPPDASGDAGFGSGGFGSGGSGTGGPPPSGFGPVGPGGSAAPPPPPIRRLRRSRTDRVATGLAGGLGRYFGVDPVIFRVLLVVLALFGGSGVVLYLLGWLAVPEDDAANAPADRAVDWLRGRSIPFGLLVAAGLFVVWLVAFSWWQPFGFVPVVIVVGAVFLLLSRRDRSVTDAPVPPTQFAAPPLSAPLAPLAADTVPLDPASVQLRSWYQESRGHSRERRRRAAPVRRTTALLLLVSLTALVIADVIAGIPFGLYFWVVGGIVTAGLLVGLLTRRPSWIFTPLLVPAIIGVLAFGTSTASAHDGFGERHWAPASAAELRSDYQLGFGRATLDLTDITTVRTDRTVEVRLGAGQARVLVPRDLPVRVVAQVHQGVITVDHDDVADGWDVDSIQTSPAVRGSAAVLTVNVDLTAGQVLIDYRD
jgi:phage shock protein PspC (stress-responsive transcriptional regulator)